MTSRGLRAAARTGLLFCALASASCGPPEGDIAIVNGRVIDPASGTDAVLNVLVRGDRIAAITTADVRAARVIDATGLVVAPGFVDILARIEADHEPQRYKIRDGVTTVVSMHGGPVDVDGWYAAFEQTGALVNYGGAVGHPDVRVAAGATDPYQPATPAQLVRMRELAARALADGAVGVGFGINYTPGASYEEIVAMFDEAARADAPAHVHSRYKGSVFPETIIQSVQEVIAAAAITGARAQILHLASSAIGSMDASLEMIEGARRNGVDIMFDLHPYLANGTRLESALYDPGWELRFGLTAPAYDSIMVVETGERLNERTFVEWRKKGADIVTFFIPRDEMLNALKHPLGMVASDGVIEQGKGHPRGAGAFAKVLGEIVREQGELSLMEALRKMTVMPAERLDRSVPEMRQRGRIAAGAYADITVFDPATIRDRATYLAPQYSEGVQHVLVNGIPVLLRGEFTRETPGRPIRRPIAQVESGQVAHSADGMVVTGSPLASAVAADVLARGGNAIDAAVAAAFTLAVVEPSMSGLGGRTQILLRTREGEFAGIDGTTEVPASYHGGPGNAGEATYGYEAIAIPGTVAALAFALERHGTWSLARVLAPAITLAEEGFALPAAEAARIASVAAQLREFEGSRHYFVRPDGTPFVAHERFRQPDLARTLRAIADSGADVFYHGHLARSMADDVVANGGFLRLSDLQSYEAEDALVVQGSYRGRQLVGTYLPASGATTIEILQILDRIEARAYAGTARWAAVVAQALLLGFEDRTEAMEPPERKASWLVSPTLATSRAAHVRVDARMPETAVRAPSHPVPEQEHTTHLSVADRVGAVVALTQSVGPIMGSKVAAPGLGFLYAATMGYLGATPPGERPFSSQSPLLVLEDGQPLYVLGAAGARRIISAIVQTVSRTLDEGLPFDQAMAAPRFHVSGDDIYLENRPEAAWTDADAAVLAAFGFVTHMRDDAPYFARIHGIARDPVNGVWTGVADPRWNGSAMAPAIFSTATTRRPR